MTSENAHRPGAHAGRVALVTGAGSGIGRATARRLESDGASVVAVDLSGEQLAWTNEHEHIISHVGDVTQADTNDSAAAAAVATFGGLDAAVLNAGISMSGDLLTMPIEAFDRAMDVNVRAVVLGLRAVVPAMLKRSGGAIAVTASTSGLGGDPNMWAYNASKAAVINLVKGAALDLGPMGIRINAVAPGPTETAMTERILGNEEIYEGLRRRTALQRWGSADEVAAAFSFLVSRDASIITGAVLAADSGITANTGQFLPAEPAPTQGGSL